MVKRLAVVMVLCCGVVGWGQLSPDEAARRMEEIKQRAATRPVDQERARLVRENAELRKQVAGLTRQLSDVQAELDRVQRQTATTKPVGKEIKKGMPLSEAEAIAGNKATLVGEDSDGNQTYTLNIRVSTEGDPQGSQVSTHRDYTMIVKNGIVADFSMVIRTSTYQPRIPQELYGH